jgi:pilus assembly protein CpaB
MSTPSDKTLRLERTKLTPQPPRGGRNTTLIIAVVAGVAAAIIAGIWLNNQKPQIVQVQAPTPAPAPVKSPVVVATRDIPAQTVITPDMIKSDAVEATKMTPNAVANTGEVVNQVVVLPIKAGQQITHDQVQPNTQQYASLAALVHNGYRAMTITLDSNSSVAGFLKPGDHVDVIGTFTVGDRTITRTVLQNVYLLATGAQVIQASADDSANNNKGGLLSSSNSDQQQSAAQPAKPAQIPNATVLVTPVDSEKLILASSKGRLMLTLRGNTDQMQTVVPMIDESAVTTIKTASQAPPPPAPAPPPAAPVLPVITKPAPVVLPPPPPPSITVIHGSTAQQVTVGA